MPTNVEVYDDTVVADQGAPGASPWPVTIGDPVTVDTQLEQAVTAAELDGLTLTARDRDVTLEVLNDQAGADAKLTFTFAEPSAPWVSVDQGDPVRVTCDADATASATHGIPIPAGGPFPLPVLATVVTVWAATGQTVSVYGTR